MLQVPHPQRAAPGRAFSALAAAGSTRRDPSAWRSHATPGGDAGAEGPGRPPQHAPAEPTRQGPSHWHCCSRWQGGTQTVPPRAGLGGTGTSCGGSSPSHWLTWAPRVPGPLHHCGTRAPGKPKPLQGLHAGGAALQQPALGAGTIPAWQRTRRAQHLAAAAQPDPEISLQASLRIPPQPLPPHEKSMASISINHTGGKLIRSLNKVSMVVCL